MTTEEKQVATKGSEILPKSETSSLLSFDDFDNFFDDFLSRRWPRLMDWNFPISVEKSFPKVDVIEHDNEIEVQAALPGVKKEDLNVEINNQSISIRAATKEEEKKEEGKYFRREISRGEFQRTFSLPTDVDSENVKAEFKDGILKISIPKTEKCKRKSIEIV